MEKALIKGYIAKRVAKEFKDGDFVNLGIGLPKMCIRDRLWCVSVIAHG